MTAHYDAIIIGTGFGGAITACRLAESGARILLLERGRRWNKSTYPRKPTDPWFYHHRHPEKHNGWLDLRLFRGMAVAQGAGVGGGSLCYSSVVMEADADVFTSPWPAEITYDELRPYYEKVRRMLALQPIPDGQTTHRYQILRRAAEKLGQQDRFERVPLAIAFDPEYSYARPDPINAKHSTTFINKQGVEQGTCVHLGNCDIGCDVHAKNTLDLNYVPSAERHGAELRPLHLARYIAPSGSGYRVFWDQLRNRQQIPGSATADRVIVAAGSLGSTEILLRSRDQHKTLPNISEMLGANWSSNANFLTPSLYPKEVTVKQGIGPTISAGLNFMDGSVNGMRFYIEDDGFPNLLLNSLAAMRNSKIGGRLARRYDQALRRGLDEKNPTEQLMVWLGEGVDASDGKLYLGRQLWRPWKREIKLDWRLQNSEAIIESIIETHRQLSDVDDAELKVPIYWRLLKSLVTVHPLGGCAMGDSTTAGVVDHRGQVFGYPNLFVADGAVLPRPTGRNPSMTIGALAERIAHLMSESG